MSKGFKSETAASPLAAVWSGVLAGLIVVIIGVIANAVGKPFPGPSLVGPSTPAFAAALATAVSAHRSRSTLGMMLALAVGMFLSAYMINVWVTHWMVLGSRFPLRRTVSPVVLGWRRDLGVAFLGIAAGSMLGSFLGRR